MAPAIMSQAMLGWAHDGSDVLSAAAAALAPTAMTGWAIMARAMTGWANDGVHKLSRAPDSQVEGFAVIMVLR